MGDKKSIALIWCGEELGYKQIELTELEAAQTLLARNGFNNLDLEPSDKGFKLTAYSNGATLTFHGKTVRELCQKTFKTILGPR